MKNKKSFLTQGLLHLVNLALLVIIVFPLLWMISSSLKTPKELFSSGINLILIVTILICNTLVNKVTGASLDKGIGG